MAARRVAVGAQVTIFAVSCGGLFVVWILKLSSESLTRTAGTMIIDATCSAPGSLQSCKEREGARARKGGEAKRRSSPHAGAHARECASISVYLMERGPDTFRRHDTPLGGVVRGAVCGFDLEVFIRILDTNGDVEHQRCSLLSPRVTSKRKGEGGSGCEKGRGSEEEP
jgi:hypothetical protein